MSHQHESSPVLSDGSRHSSREVQTLLWLAAGTAWAIVALKAWSETRKSGARRHTFAVSERLLHQVFPHGIRR